MFQIFLKRAAVLFCLVILFSVEGLSAQPKAPGNCVVQVYPVEFKREGKLLECFNTVSEALSFASNGNIIVPADASVSQVSSAIRNFQATSLLNERQSITSSTRGEVTPAADHVVAIQWSYPDRGENALVFRSTSLCSTTSSGHILSTNYAISHPSWNNSPDSSEAFAGCRSIQAYDLAGLSGASITCTPYCNTMGAMNNATTSSRTWK